VTEISSENGFGRILPPNLMAVMREWSLIRHAIPCQGFFGNRPAIHVPPVVLAGIYPELMPKH
jgi:hypothetical protein